MKTLRGLKLKEWNFARGNRAIWLIVEDGTYDVVEVWKPTAKRYSVTKLEGVKPTKTYKEALKIFDERTLYVKNHIPFGNMA